MIRELKAFQKKLTNLTGNNKSILQQRLSASQDFDLHFLDFLNSVSSFEIIDFLFSKKKVLNLCHINDSRNSSVNEASKNLKKILRQTHFLLEERGVKELYIGWPFVLGKFKNGTQTRCPLLFFPIDITQKDDYWRIEKRHDENICFNKSFLLAYSFFNETPLSEEFIEHQFEESEDSQIFRNELYKLLKASALEINFNSELFENKLKNLHQYKKNEFDNEFKPGILRLENNANLGIYPQSGSYLMPDYDSWISNNSHDTFEDFFLSKNQISPDKFKQISSIKEEQTFTPFQIDASQELALKAVKQGNSIVVQGPPGTGKSQLICNLISDFIARGKNVLVVSQKRVALDVVHKRLQEKNLGDFVNVIHDFKNDRKKTYQQIENQISNLSKYQQQNNELDTIYLEREYTQTCRKIDQLSEQFEEFKTALFDTKECGISAKELYVTSSLEDPTIKLTQEYRIFNSDKIEEFNNTLEWLFPYAKTFNSENFSWFDRQNFAEFTTSDLTEILNTLKNIPLYQTDFSNKVKALLGENMSIEESKWILDRKKTIDELLEIISDTSIYTLFKNYIRVKTDKDWLLIKERQVLECFKKEGLESQLSKEELVPFQESLEGYLHSRNNFLSRIKWWLFNKDKYKIKRTLVANSLTWHKNDINALANKVDNRLNLEHQLTKLKECKWLITTPKSPSKTDVQKWFDEHLAALEAKNISEELRSFIQHIPFEAHNEIEVTDIVNQVINWCSVANNQLNLWKKHLTKHQITKLLENNESGIQWAEQLKEHFDNLCLYDKTIKHFSSEEKATLTKLIDEAVDSSTAQHLFQNSIRITWIEHIETKHPILKLVSTLKFEQDEKELQACVKRKLKLSKEILQLKVREQTYRSIEYNRLNNRITYRELEHQVTKKKKIWPVRKTITEFKNELFNLIPCWLASPESVSAIFPMDLKFDLVIFDEASQCFTEKGLPAIYRAKQVVITGDKHQLSPNDLYQVRFEEEEEISSNLEVDSLLDLTSKYFLQTQLNGHYRSESLDLIDFSNQRFYNGKLQLIPHFEKINTTKPGITYHEIDGQWDNGANPIEAQAVVQHLFDLVKAHEESIGIVTFNYKQQNLILDLIDDYSLKEKITLPESVFVKNIENVQGDERDIILFSIGYAKNSSGKINAHFGSLNMDRGENRLNVAVTRARKKIELFSSILPHQLHVEESKHDGPKLFKEYLNYAYNVSNGNFKPALETKVVKTKAWYLNTKLNNILKENFNINDNLPFADITMKKENTVIGIINTDDNAYYTSPSVKEHHCYKPLILKTLKWPFVTTYSRDYWKNKNKVSSNLTSYFK